MPVNQWHWLIAHTLYILFLYYQGWPGNSQHRKKNVASDPNPLMLRSSYRSSRTVLEAIRTKVCSYDKEVATEEKIIK